MYLLTTTEPPATAPWTDATGRLSGRWLHVMGGRPPGERICFTLVGDGAVGLAGTTGYLVTDPHAYAPFNPYDLMWSAKGVFVCQAPTDPTRGPVRANCFPALNLVQPGYDCTIASTGSAYTAGLIDSIVSWARAHDVAIVAALYADEDTQRFLHGPAWQCYQGCERMTLTVPTEILAGQVPLPLTSRNSRRQVRTDLRVLAGNHVWVSRAPVGAHTDHILRLRRHLVRKYGSYTSIAADEAQLASLYDTYGESGLRLWLGRAGDDPEPIGFGLFTVDHPHQWSAYWVGSAAGDPRADRLYFASLFYAPATQAVAESVHTLDYGLGCDEGKARRGCIARRRPVLIRPLTACVTPDPAYRHPRALARRNTTTGASVAITDTWGHH